MAIQFIPTSSDTDYMESSLSSDYTLSNNFTMCCWIRFTSDSNTAPSSVAYMLNGSGRFFDIIVTASNRIVSRIYSDNGRYTELVSASGYNKGEQLFVSTTYDGTTARLYGALFGDDVTLLDSDTDTHDSLTNPKLGFGLNNSGNFGIRPIVLGEMSVFKKSLNTESLNALSRGASPAIFGVDAYVPAYSAESTVHDVIKGNNLVLQGSYFTTYSFKSTANSTFTAPFGSSYKDVKLYGAGGQGGGSSVTLGGGGGGGGAKAEKNYTANLNSDYSYTIGSGGSSSGVDQNGQNGGSSTYDTMTSGGGQGGRSASNGGAGGSGGTASGGDTNTSGNSGQPHNNAGSFSSDVAGGDGGISLIGESYNAGGDGADASGSMVVAPGYAGEDGKKGLVVITGDYDRTVEHFPVESYNYPYITSGTASTPAPPGGTTVPPLYYNIDKQRRK